MVLSYRYKRGKKANVVLSRRQECVRDDVVNKIQSGIYREEATGCPICNDASKSTSNTETCLSETDRYGIPFRVVACTRCGLIYTDPRMNQESYTAFYQTEYRKLYHEEDVFTDSLFQSEYGHGASISSFLNQCGVQLDNARVIEVGCGAGGTLAYLRDAFNCKVIGCDFGEEAISFGVKRHHLEIRSGDITCIPASFSADLVIYNHVFEHVLDPIHECKQVRSRLRRGGVLFLEVPGVKNIRASDSWYCWDFLRLLQNAHTYHFTLESLVNTLGVGGFECLAGNQKVQAAFRPSDSAFEFNNDYVDVMRFLRSTEYRRFAGAITRRLGLHRWIRRIFDIP